MLYKKYPMRPRRLFPNYFGFSYPEQTKEITEAIHIPSPNDPEPDTILDTTRKCHNHSNPLASIVDSVKNGIKLDDIILIGLILLFIFESVEDEIMLIILIYILISGFGKK